eukprot:719529_1
MSEYIVQSGPDDSGRDDNDDGSEEDDTKYDDSSLDLIDGLKKRLKFNQRCHYSRKIVESSMPGKNKQVSGCVALRDYDEVYRDFRTELDAKSAYDMRSFPRGKRFGIFVDRTHHGDAPDEMSTEMTFFQQLNECDSIPINHVEEWFIQARRECLIPGIDDKQLYQTKRGKYQRITAQDHVDGQLLTFSFDVEAIDEVKCYINWNGQAVRFTGDNLERILSCLFVESEPSIKIQKNGLLTKSFEENVVDIPFENFCAQIQGGYEHNGDGYRQGQKSF